MTVVDVLSGGAAPPRSRAEEAGAQRRRRSAYALLAPALVLVIGIFTIATNLMADGLAEASQKGD